MRRTLLALALCLASAAAAAEWIKRIEPAHWWAGMKNPRLQLLVHGEGIAALEPAIADARVTLRSTIRTANPNYLFIDLLIAPDAAPGSFEVAFRQKGRTLFTRDYRLLAREPDSAERHG